MKARLGRWLRPPRRFPPTREGWWFLGATLLVGAAAVNGGINLLFLVFGMMLSLILASGVLSELSLRGLTVTRRPPASIHAGSPFLMGMAVRNGKKRIPTFSLEVEDLIEGKPVDRRCYYLKLPAGRLQETAYRHTLARRGVHRLTAFRLSTRFPFGFIRKSRDVDAPAELVVYPALVPVPEIVLTAGRAEAGRRYATTRSRSGEFEGLREFRSGDDPRDIHWRTTARRGRMFVRESEEETGRTVVILLDDGDDLPPDDAFEATVSLAASIAVTLVKKGLQVGLVVRGTFLPPAPGPIQASHILRALALVQAGVGGDRPTLPAAARSATTIRVSPGAASPRFEVSTAAGARRTA